VTSGHSPVSLVTVWMQFDPRYEQIVLCQAEGIERPGRVADFH
jgi:hypothetical protein